MKYTEFQRLAAVNRFKQLDSVIKQDLDEIAVLVSEICETPVALVTLLDENIQWFKASVGTEVECTIREFSFCNYTIQQKGVYIIPDMEKDGRFNSNPLVAGEPHVRFYAGATLLTKDGHAIGSLCVIDMKPRKLTAHQQKSLMILAKQVVNLMELNWSLNTLEQKHAVEQEQAKVIIESELKLKAIFDSTNDTHVLADKNFEVLAYNKSAAAFITSRYKTQLSNGDCLLDYIDPAILSGFKKYFSLALTGVPIKREWQLMPGTLDACWKITTFIPVHNKQGLVIGVAINSTDITHQKRQEAYIHIQNEALNRIAFIQSHELRRPVASLLGIMDLIKIDNLSFDYFDMMELTVNELDEKIRGIVKDSEDTLHGRHLAVVA